MEDINYRTIPEGDMLGFVSTKEERIKMSIDVAKRIIPIATNGGCYEEVSVVTPTDPNYRNLPA